MIRDPGLQLERTVLAWFRTMWLGLLLSVVMIKFGVMDQAAHLLFGAIGLFVLSLLLLGGGHWRAKKFRYEGHKTSDHEAMMKKWVSFLISLVALLNLLKLLLGSLTS